MSHADFPYTGSNFSWTVPAGIDQAVLETWGGATTGKRGGYRRVITAVTPGETLTGWAGQAGDDNAGWPNGGAGTNKGAGSSEVLRGTDRLCVAGGAGASAFANDRFTLLGGAGGALVGEDGNGKGGTQTAGGAGGTGGSATGSPGQFGPGGAGAQCGGGGGWWGGGGGNTRIPGAAVSDNSGGGGSNGGTATDILADERGVASPDGSSNGYVRISWDASLTASTDVDNAPPRNQISLFSLDGTSVVIERIDPAGNRALVRSGNNVALSGGSWVGFDTEAPYGVPVAYLATSNTGATATTANPVTLNPRTPWLVHPGVPSFSVPIPGVLLPVDEDTDVNEAEHIILGREDPIIVNDGVRHTPAFELVIRTDDMGDTVAIRRILADAVPLLLQVAYEWTGVVEYRWVNCSGVKESRRSADFSDGGRNFTIQCREVIAPSSQQQAQWTWNDVVANYATWDDVVAAFPTWNDLVTNSPRA